MNLEVFCSSGGMAEGLRRAGITIDMAIDADIDACDSYEANLGHRSIQIDARELLRMVQAGWSPGAVDLLIADPPCTPWSRAGKRLGQADERDMLDVTVQLVREIAPRAFLIANVPGLEDGPNWPIVQATIGSLSREGYCVDFQRLDAADYGVPQHRIRPFWYGHRVGTRHIAWPARTHAAPEECGATLPGITEPRKLWVTCREALQHLPVEDLGSPVRLRWRGNNGNQIASVPDAPARVVGTSSLSDGNILAHPDDAFRDRREHRHPGRKARASSVDEPAHVVTTRCNGDGNTLTSGPNHRASRADAPARTLTRNTHSDGALLAHERHPISRPDSPSFTVTTKGDGRGAQGACVLEWPRDRPGTTIQTDQRMGPPGPHEKSFLTDNRGHGPNAIKLSEKAAAILQGFPPGWVFSGPTKRSRWSQIGQAMPPPLAEAIGASIVEAMREHTRGAA
jgi:site-specific DNA-cytosine methylase